MYTLLVFSLVATASALEVPGRCDAPVGQRASCYEQHWEEPPTRVPSGLSTDGPLVGNGDLGVAATGSGGTIVMYTGKNDFFATRDVPSAGCAYGLMGSGSLSISLVAPPSPPPPPSPPSPAFNCSLFGCTCQGFANYYGAIKGVGWGCAPQPAGRMWWSGHDCNAATQHGQFCDGPACTLPGHAPCDPPAPSPGVGGSWSASQDLQNAKVHVATTQGGTNLTTTTFIATGSNVMLTTLLLNHTATMAFELRFPTGDEGHATHAGVAADGTPYVAGENIFRDRNYASLLPCSLSNIIAPSVRTMALATANGTLQVMNGTARSVGCFVLLDGGVDVIHEPLAKRCSAYGDAARWKAVAVAIPEASNDPPATAAGADAAATTLASKAPAAAAAASKSVLLQNLHNSSACLTYGNGTPTDFGSRRVFAGPCSTGTGISGSTPVTPSSSSSSSSSNGWEVDPTTLTIAASNQNLFSQQGQQQCLTAAPPNYNNSIVQGFSIVTAAGGAVPLGSVEVADDVVRWQCNLSAGTIYSLALSSLTRRDVGDVDPLDAAVALARTAAANSTALANTHRDAWSAYWQNCASVSLGERRTLLEGYWYGSQYLFGSATALGKVPPGLWGPWVTGSSRSGWGGDFTLDYNFQANFWGAASSNMPGLILPFVDTILRLLPLGEARAAAPDWHTARGFFGAAGQRSQGMQCGHSPNGWSGPLGQCPASAELGGYAGLNFPGHMGPWSGQEFPTDMGIRSVAAFAWTPLMNMFDTTHDHDLLQTKIYPYLRGIVDFYLNPDPAGGGKSYLQTGSDGLLHVPYSCGDEICHDELGLGYGVDPMEDMGFVRMALAKAIEYSEVLGTDAALRPRWAAALGKMAPFRTTQVNGVTVFAQSASFLTPDWNITNQTGGWPGSGRVYTGYPIIYDSGIHPADVITRSSEPTLLQVARNTVWTDGELTQWNPTNGFVLSWIPAARIVERANASTLLDGFEAAINSSVYLNWYHPHGGGGYEDVGAVEAVNCMLLLSIEGFVRFFPAWPVGETASFVGLRASGAFVVTASINAQGTVGTIELKADVGGNFAFLSPWPTAATMMAPAVRCGGAVASVGSLGEGKFGFPTKPGQSCTITAP